MIAGASSEKKLIKSLKDAGDVRIRLSFIPFRLLKTFLDLC